MKSLLWALLVAATLAGCVGETSGQKLVAMRPGDWPTPTPALPIPRPSPFPMVTLPATASQVSGRSVAGLAAPAATQMPARFDDPPPAEPAPTVTGHVAASALNLRAGPGTNYPVVGSLAEGGQFAAGGRNAAGDWLLIEANGVRAWVAASLVSLDSGASALPQLSAPPPVPSGGSRPAAIAPGNSAGAPQAATGPAGGGTRAGRLVFQLASGGDIMIINADGSALRRLTDGIDPALSYDGRMVAFTRWQGDQGSVWVINSDGTGEREIADGLRKAKGAEWSPDGKQVVVNYSHEGRPDPVDECKPLGRGGARPPAGAYDVHVEHKNGKAYLCYTLPADEHWTLHVITLVDGKAEDLYGGMYSFRPTWDPTKSWRIVSQAGNGLLETSVNKDHYQYLTDQAADEAPSFSPDGRFLAITSKGDGSRYDIFRLNSDGSGRTRLTDMPLWETVGPDAQPLQNNLSPVWSPDGSQIAFLTDRSGRWEIWVMGADGSNPHPMFSKAVNDQLNFVQDFVDERILSWR